MTDMKLRKLVLAALFAALCTVMTMVIQVPSPMQGYVNLGDCAVLLSAWVLGPWYGGAAAGLGSMLADLLPRLGALSQVAVSRADGGAFHREVPAADVRRHCQDLLCREDRH